MRITAPWAYTKMDYKGRINIPIDRRESIRPKEQDFFVLRLNKHVSKDYLFGDLKVYLDKYFNAHRFFSELNFKHEYLQREKWWEKVMVVFVGMYRKKLSKDFRSYSSHYVNSLEKRYYPSRKYLIISPFIRIPHISHYFKYPLPWYGVLRAGKKCVILEGGESQLLDIDGEVWRIFIPKYLREYSGIDYKKRLVLVEKKFGLEIWTKEAWEELPPHLKNFDEFGFRKE